MMGNGRKQKGKEEMSQSHGRTRQEDIRWNELYPLHYQKQSTIKASGTTPRHIHGLAIENPPLFLLLSIHPSILPSVLLADCWRECSGMDRQRELVKGRGWETRRQGATFPPTSRSCKKCVPGESGWICCSFSLLPPLQNMSPRSIQRLQTKGTSPGLLLFLSLLCLLTWTPVLAQVGDPENQVLSSHPSPGCSSPSFDFSKLEP